MICDCSSSGLMERRNKRKTCMQMQHRSEFFGLCFSYSFMDFCSDTKCSKLCVFSACQSSLSLERAVHYGSLSVHLAAAVNSGIPLLGASSFSLV